MRSLLALSLIGATTLTAGCATTRQPATSINTSTTIGTAVLASPDGTVSGSASLTASGEALSLRVDVTGASPGEHGIHLHATGQCAAPDFASAGGHLNPHGRQHGTRNPQGSHLGDMPNLAVGADGKGSLTMVLPGGRTELEALLFDADGTAVVLHAGPDDLATDPSGMSGARIACGAFTRTP